MQRALRRQVPPLPLIVFALVLDASGVSAQPAAEPEEAPAEAPTEPAAPVPEEAPAPEETPAEPAPEAPAEPAAEELPSKEAQPSEPPVSTRPTEPAEAPTLPTIEPLAEAPEKAKPVLVMSPSFFNRYELRRNYASVGKTAGRFSDFDAVAYRARMKFELKDVALGDDASLDIVFNPQASGFWIASGELNDIDLDLHEGYILPRFGVANWFQLGRFEMVYGDQWLIGPVGWHQTGRSFDGARLHIQTDSKGPWLDIFGNWLQDGEFDGLNGGTDRVHDGDAFLVGAYGDIGALIMEGMNLDIYTLLHLWAQTDDLPPVDPADPAQSRDAAAEITVGARAKAAYDVLDYRLEGGLQGGERAVGAATPDVLAGAVDFELGLKVHPKLRLAAQGFFYSGDDPTTAKNEGWLDRYSTAHKWNGWTDVMLPRTDQLGGVLHAVSSPTSSLKLGVLAHVFARPHPFAAQDDGYNGTELDVFSVLALLPGLTLRAEYDVFLPADAYTEGDPVHFFSLELRYQGSVQVGVGG